MLCNDDFINKSSNKIAPSSILRICENAQKINFPNLLKFSHNSARAQKPTSNVYIKLKINVLQPIYQASQPTHQPAAYLIMLLMVFNEWLQHYGVTLLFRKWEFLKCITLANCTQLFNQDIAFGPDEMMFSSKNQIKMFLIIFEKFKLRLSVDLWAQVKRTTKKNFIATDRLHLFGCSSKWFLWFLVGWSISASICIFPIIIIMLERCNAQRRNK